MNERTNEGTNAEIVAGQQSLQQDEEKVSFSSWLSKKEIL